MRFLLDANVFISAIEGREPYAHHARLILALGEIGEFDLWVSAAQVTDVYYVLSGGGKKSKATWAKQTLDELLQIVQVCSFTLEESGALLPLPGSTLKTDASIRWRTR